MPFGAVGACFKADYQMLSENLVEKRLEEQRSAFERLLASTFPFTLKIQSEA
jgi:hypothetical protein